jgi:hypothetical protein
MFSVDHPKTCFTSNIIAFDQQQVLRHVLDVGEQHIGSVAPVSIPPSLADGSDTHPMHGYRIGVFWDWFNDATPEVVDCCKSALNILCAKGAEVGTLRSADSMKHSHE